jgi:hypothetical protein
MQQKIRIQNYSMREIQNFLLNFSYGTNQSSNFKQKLFLGFFFQNFFHFYTNWPIFDRSDRSLLEIKPNFEDYKVTPYWKKVTFNPPYFCSVDIHYQFVILNS